MTNVAESASASITPFQTISQKNNVKRDIPPTAEMAARETEGAAKVSISNEATQFTALKTYVRQLLEEQGVELTGEYWDGLTTEEAQRAIGEGGEWSAEAVAGRIINFVAEVGGGDPELKERLQEAVRQGFQEARLAFGGWLPEVSEQTFDLVMERFDEAFQQSDGVAANQDVRNRA